MTWPTARVDRPRLITLTRLPTTDDGALDWDRTRAQVRDLGRRLRQDYGCEWAWAVERNPRGTGYHCHAIQHGSYIPQRELQNRWGGRRVDIRAIKPDAAQYVIKEAAQVAGYALKGGRQDPAAHLAMNGGRVYHNSAGYHLGLTRREVWTRVGQRREEERTWVLLVD